MDDEERGKLTLGQLYDMMSEEDRKKAFFFMFRTVEFYASTDTWFAVALFPDPPAGAIIHDYRKDADGRARPGGRARLVYYWLLRALGKAVGHKGPFQMPWDY